MTANGPIAGTDQAAGVRALAGNEPAPRWITVAGGKGGVGKTLLATNLALLLARAGHRTLLVDLDPGLGNVDVHLRLSPPFTVEDLANGVCTAEQAVVRGPGGLQVLAGRSGSTLLAHGDTGTVTRVLAAVDTAARRIADVIVCDTGAGIGPAVLATIERADLAISVTNPDPASLTDTYALCKLLQMRQRPLPGLVLNRVRSREEAMQTAGKLATVCKRFLTKAPRLLGHVRSEPQLETSVTEQRPFALHGSGAALDDLRALSAAVLSALPPLGRRRAELPPPTRSRLRAQLA